MRIVTSARSVERELRRHGWWEAAQALQARGDNWFVQVADEFILCRNGHLSFTKVAFTDDPVSIWLFKGTLGGLEQLSWRTLSRAVGKNRPRGGASNLPARQRRHRRSATPEGRPSWSAATQVNTGGGGGQDVKI